VQLASLAIHLEQILINVLIALYYLNVLIVIMEVINKLKIKIKSINLKLIMTLTKLGN